VDTAISMEKKFKKLIYQFHSMETLSGSSSGMVQYKGAATIGPRFKNFTVPICSLTIPPKNSPALIIFYFPQLKISI
jgi:hypothetical protein